MKNILLYIKNNILSEAIQNAFLNAGDFRVERLNNSGSNTNNDITTITKVDVLLMDVSLTAGNTLNEKLILVKDLKKIYSNMKIAVLCDTTMSKTISDEVILAKQTKEIDTFFFESVTSDYLVAYISSL